MREHIRMLRPFDHRRGALRLPLRCALRQTEYIFMWFQVTQAIFTGGAGAAIIGGLYWKKGTAQGAWAAVLTGSLLSVSGILLRQVYNHSFPAEWATDLVLRDAGGDRRVCERLARDLPGRLQPGAPCCIAALMP